ncbi:MAG: hypothetical protein ACFFA1_02325 [Promethearchaeota archaeon]
MKEKRRKYSGLWDEKAINEITSTMGVWKYDNRVRLCREFIK